MLEERRISKITVDNYDYTVTWEVPYSDTSLDDLLQGFVSCLVGVTYSEENILRGMYEYAKERLNIDFDDYENNEKNEN